MYDYERPRMPLGTKVGLFLLSGCVLAGCTLLIVLAVRYDLNRPREDPPAPALWRDTPEDGPWPECAQCLACLRENTGEPASLTVVRWEWRKTFDEKGHAFVLVSVKYRAKNRYGAYEVRRALFMFKDGQFMGGEMH
jgi:hypothetical protein